MINVAVAGLFVQQVHVLRHHADGSVLIFVLQTGNRQMSRVRLRLLQIGFQIVVKVVHRFRIAPIGLDRRHLLDPVVVPQSVTVAKSRNPRFGRNSGTAQNDNISVHFPLSFRYNLPPVHTGCIPPFRTSSAPLRSFAGLTTGPACPYLPARTFEAQKISVPAIGTLILPLVKRIVT